ncbi:MAG: restriction endonuclease subunit S [Pirellulaceae bacterium]
MKAVGVPPSGGILGTNGKATNLLTYFDRIADAPDAIPQLRRFILDLAVRGKLVEQDPKDEPAEELYERIQAEKARLAKLGEIRKTKAMEAIDEDDIPFAPPRGWKWVRIREVTSNRGQMVPSEDFTYIDVSAINKEVGCIADATVLSADEAPSRARKVVHTGDVIYSCVRPYLLNIAIVETNIVPPPIASTAFAILNGFGLVIPKYLWIVLRSPYFVECVESKMRGQAYPAINDSDFAQLPIPLPPLAEQQRIVAKVDELMALCDRLERAQQERETRRDQLVAAVHSRVCEADAKSEIPNPKSEISAASSEISNLTSPFPSSTFLLHHLPSLTTRHEHIQQLRQSIMSLAVIGELTTRNKKDGAAIDGLVEVETKKRATALRKSKTIATISTEEQWCALPEEWVWARWDQITDWITYGFTRPMPHADAGIPIVTGKNVNYGKIVFETAHRTTADAYSELNDKDKPIPGDILVTKDGSIGRSAIVETTEPFCINQSVAVLWLRSCHFDRRYLQLAIDCPQTQQAFLAKTEGVAIKHISVVDLGKMAFPLPPLAEQHRIVAKVDQLLALCDQLETHLATAQADSRRLLAAVLHEALM